MIDITNINKAKLLAGLYNNSRPQGMGFLHANTNELTIVEAEECLKFTNHFDYINGRVMKIDLSTNELDPALYDRDIGQGAAQRVVDQLRKESI